MTWIDFLLQYLALVLASLTVFGLSILIGYYTIRHLINKAMQSEPIKDVKKTLDELQKQGEKLIREIDNILHPDPTKREGYQG